MHRTDSNQKEIVEGLRMAGVSVKVLSQVGHGCPDLLCGFRGLNLLLEVKDGKKPPSQRKLTEAEQKFFDEWRGQRVTVESLEAALMHCGVI